MRSGGDGGGVVRDQFFGQRDRLARRFDRRGQVAPFGLEPEPTPGRHRAAATRPGGLPRDRCTRASDWRIPASINALRYGLSSSAAMASSSVRRRTSTALTARSRDLSARSRSTSARARSDAGLEPEAQEGRRTEDEGQEQGRGGRGQGRIAPAPAPEPSQRPDRPRRDRPACRETAAGHRPGPRHRGIAARGSFSRHFSVIVSRLRGTSGRWRRGGTGSVETTSFMVSIAEAPRNGGRPVSAW